MPRSFIGRIALGIGTAVVVFYAATIGYFRSNERDLVFPREGGLAELPPPADSLRLPVRAVVITTSDSARLGAWVIPSTADDSTGMWILLCHGQTGNVATTTRPEYYAYARATGVNILAFDWRGFGTSTGTPSEAGLYRDATAAYGYLRDSLGVPADRIVIFGHSLGTAPAIELATRVPAAGLIVEGGPTSVRDRGQEVYPWFPIRLAARSDFNSIGRIASVTMPILFMHATRDARIPFAHGQRLHAAATAPKRLVALKGEHHNAFLADSAVYFTAYKTFVRGVLPKHTAPGPLHR
jgi:fermentation-respiration switch protein FrsA (DUF1100 family)